MTTAIILSAGYAAGVLTCVLFGIFFLYLVTKDVGKSVENMDFVGECVDGNS